MMEFDSVLSQLWQSDLSEEALAALQLQIVATAKVSENTEQRKLIDALEITQRFVCDTGLLNGDSAQGWFNRMCVLHRACAEVFPHDSARSVFHFHTTQLVRSRMASRFTDLEDAFEREVTLKEPDILRLQRLHANAQSLKWFENGTLYSRFEENKRRVVRLIVQGLEREFDRSTLPQHVERWIISLNRIEKLSMVEFLKDFFVDIGSQRSQHLGSVLDSVCARYRCREQRFNSASALKDNKFVTSCVEGGNGVVLTKASSAMVELELRSKSEARALTDTIDAAFLVMHSQRSSLHEFEHAAQTVCTCVFEFVRLKAFPLCFEETPYEWHMRQWERSKAQLHRLLYCRAGSQAQTLQYVWAACVLDDCIASMTSFWALHQSLSSVSSTSKSGKATACDD